jgi:hypothetical protein
VLTRSEMVVCMTAGSLRKRPAGEQAANVRRVHERPGVRRRSG